MTTATIAAKCYPTEDLTKVEKAILNLFPGGRVERTADGIMVWTESLARFKELIRRHRILDTTRRVMLRGMQEGRTSFELNKQAALMSKVSFLEGRVALGGLKVTIEDEDLEKLVDEVAPITINGEEVCA